MSGSGRIWLDTHRFVYLVPESEPETIIFSRRRLFFHRSRNWFKSNRLRNTGGGWLGLCEGASNVVGCGGWCFKFIRLFAILKVLLTIMVSDMVSLEFFLYRYSILYDFATRSSFFISMNAFTGTVPCALSDSLMQCYAERYRLDFFCCRLRLQLLQLQ